MIFSICWECLGQGYLQRGSYTAAWRAFERAYTLNPDAVYSLYQMATVKQVSMIEPSFPVFGKFKEKNLGGNSSRYGLRYFSDKLSLLLGI